MSLRADLELISEWITPGSRTLDLGCGDGSLLAHLRDQRQVNGYGLELDVKHVTAGIRRGVKVIHTDLNAGLADFDVDSFDYVVMTQALQMVRHPDKLLDEMLRIGKEGIVTFPNFGYWKCRLAVARGQMPVTPGLPNHWYNTDNIHLCTVRDFENLCAQKGIKILRRVVLDSNHQADLRAKTLPNLFGEIALYHFSR
jgi:methionine biosynthesis protein MetW